MIRPFDPYKEPNTLKTYFKLARRVLVYFHRVAAGDEYFFSAEPEDCIRPEDNVEPTEEQLEVWHAVCMLAQHEIPVEDEERQSQLKTRLVEFWMLLVCQNTGSRRCRSPLLSFCAMLSITPSTQGWLKPGNFNNNLSATIWVVQRLFFYDSARKERDELYMDQIPTLLESECRDYRKLLYDDLMFGTKDISFMRAWALKDGTNVDTAGWNFTQHRDNELLLRGTGKILLAAIERSHQLCRIFLTDTGNPANGYTSRGNALASYEATVQQLLKRLCVLIHVSGGQPVRESEFFAITWRSTQRRRSFIVCHERVMIHVKYHKGQQQTGRYKENVRFLAHPIGELLLDYIVYVLPLRHIFLRQQTPKALLSPFIWEKDDKTKFASQISVFEANVDDEDVEEIEDDVRIMTRQRNHKTQTINRAYANQT
ncbi:hypothetical protein B0A48_18652 [Cryoendolithus antarcticus]|uniref:Uncharacterized protein n=1 Tax=Cryoendolithus antarcticus TaxID=1507870 RepID=A0A1V8S8C7_9PEZI|nr:hypothetical protein B0A48_18652 [Cryoendolithus antarcticus]